MKRYETRCHDCNHVFDWDWFSSARSDADWHNTMTGHDPFVVDLDDNDTVVYSLAETSEAGEF